MRSIEDKGCYNYGPTQEFTNGSSISSEFHKGNNGATNRGSQHQTALGKPSPSKWDDAQKWLVGLSRGGGGGAGEKNHQSKTKPRNSNADDTRLIAPVPQKEKDYSSDEGEEEEKKENANHLEAETKKVNCDESIWRINKPNEKSKSAAVRSICVRDMGTEMTPIASQEPSRTATPIRARTPVGRSPISSGSSTPARCPNGESRCEVLPPARANVGTNNNSEQGRKLSPLETRAMAWDEAERAKYMARFKREEVKIQAWENHEKRKAEMEMKRMEVKAERLKSRAQERLANKLAATRRIAEEKRANAEAELNEKAVKTSEKADYIRRTGHLPSSFSIKLPSLCW